MCVGAAGQEEERTEDVQGSTCGEEEHVLIIKGALETISSSGICGRVNRVVGEDSALLLTWQAAN